jgi:CheY-like chemotaxis protein
MNLKSTILLVEDSGFQREFATQCLKEIGFQRIIEAKDGIEAFKYLQRIKASLVISDWEMPNLDGLGLFEKLKNDLIYESILSILLTTKDEKENIISARKAGVNHYLLKPLEKKYYIKNLRPFSVK